MKKNMTICLLTVLEPTAKYIKTYESSLVCQFLFQYLVGKSLLIWLAVFLIGVVPVFAQKEYLQPGKKYSNVKVYTNDYKTIKVSSLKQINDSVDEFIGLSNNTEQLSLNNIKYLSVRRSSHALSYGLIGGGIGLFSSALAAADARAKYPDVKFNSASFILGFTLGCGAVGAIIGAMYPNWKRVYIKDNRISLYGISTYYQNKMLIINLIITI